MWKTASSGVEFGNAPIGLDPQSFLFNVGLGTGYADVTHITVSGFPNRIANRRLQEHVMQFLAASSRVLQITTLRDQRHCGQVLRMFQSSVVKGYPSEVCFQVRSNLGACTFIRWSAPASSLRLWPR